jgi:hypothetical protein
VASTRSNPGKRQNAAAQMRSRLKKTKRKHRSTDIGRAIRSVYDDTVREEVPDDFLDLLGKLS